MSGKLLCLDGCLRFAPFTAESRHDEYLSLSISLTYLNKFGIGGDDNEKKGTT